MSIPAISPYPMPALADIAANRVSWRPDPQRSVLLIHDMQKYFMNFFDQGEEPVTSLMTNILRLKSACKAAGIPVLYTAQPGNQDPADRALLTDFWGTGLEDDPQLTDIVNDLAPEADEWVLTKWRYSAFKHNGLQALMQEMRRDQMIICGVYAHIGCMQSAADAFMYDIQPFMVSDALADFSAAEHQMALDYVARRCGVVLDCEAMLNSLQALDSTASASFKQSVMKDIATLLYLSPGELDPHQSLIDQGLDSIRMMTLIEQWRAQGVDIEFADLAEKTTLTEWLAVLKTRVSEPEQAPEPEVAHHV